MEKQPSRDPKLGQAREQGKTESHGGDVHKKALNSGREGILLSSTQTKLPAKDASQTILETDVVGESARRQQVASFSSCMRFDEA